MTCSACGTTNEPGRKFCKECGQRLVLGCPACGAANAADDKFCGECGNSLEPTRRPEPVAGPGPAPAQLTERRLVSVVFVDLVGFTTFSEARDAEDVRAMLGRYFDAASDAVQRHGGVVEKFIGDAVMAVWGTPVAHEDDAERAVRSALEIVDRVGALGTSLGMPLQARAGVMTGEAVATMGAVDQGMVAGDLVNTASRLQSAAEPGTVLVGDGTFRASSRAISFVSVDALSLKGKQEPLSAWRAVRVVGEVGGFGRGSAPEPPFGGRDEELRLVKELLHATGREGRPRLVAISGVAGIGKSRLVWELQKYVDGLTESVYWHQGRCPSYGEGVTFWAFAEMVRGRAGIADTDDDDTARERLAVCLADLVPDADERRWLEPRLGHLIGLAGPPPGDREELFGAWRRFVERVADRGTTALVFEDLHWADPGLMDFVESLLEWSRTSPVLVVTLARPELAERRPTWGAGLRSSTAIHLDRLPDGDIRTMVTGYVDGLPADGLDRLVSRAEGIPLYAVETVRMLADRGVLEQTGESYRVVSDLGGELDVPETLHALVAARLDGLPDDDRALVQDASVAGHSFTLATVAAVSGRAADELEPRLRALVRKEILDQDADPRSPERGQYRFVQSVIQEVAYSTLSKAVRRTKHLACARRFESLDDEELAGVVASHYLEAYRSEPGSADAEDLAGHARTWLGRAAERASSLGSPEQALGFAVQALSLAGGPRERAGLLARAASAALFSGDLDAGWTYVAEASDCFRADDDAHGEGELLANVARYPFPELARTDLGDRLTYVEEQLTDDRGPVRVLVLSALADTASAEGRHQDALRWSGPALELAQTLHDDQALRSAGGARGWALMNVGRHWEGKLMAEGLVVLASRSGSALEEARATMSLGIMIAEDDPRRCLQTFLDTAEIAGRAGIRPMQAMALANAAEAAADLGDWDTAEAALAGAASNAGQLYTQIDTDTARMTEAMMAALRGDGAAATQIMTEVEQHRADWAAIQLHSWFLRVRGLVRLNEGDATGAYDDAWEAVELESSGANTPSAVWVGVQAACELRDATRVTRIVEATSGLRGRWIDVVRRTAHGAVTALEGDRDAGAAQLAGALDEWLELELPLDHALATVCAGASLEGIPALAEHASRARAYVEGLRADGLLRRLDRATAQGPA